MAEAPAGQNAPVTGAAKRRSTRLSRRLPLNILGYNRIGTPFHESTSTIVMNCHGCLYHSRHEYRSGSWITLQVATPQSNGHASPVRAQVKYVRLPRNPRELYQVGVEFESASNIWGILSPPEDWLQFGDHPKAFGDASRLPGNVATGNGAAEDLLSALEGRLRQKADGIVMAILTDKLTGTLVAATKSLEDAVQTNARRLEDSCATMRERLLSSAFEELRIGLQAAVAGTSAQIEALVKVADEAAERLEKRAATVQSGLAEAIACLDGQANRSKRNLAAAIEQLIQEAGASAMAQSERARDDYATNLAKRAEIITDEANARVEQRPREAQAQLESAAGTALAAFHVSAQTEIDQSISDARGAAQASLADILNDACSKLDHRERASHEALTREAEAVTEEFRRRLETIMNGTISAAVSAVREHSERLLTSLTGAASGENRDARSGG
jgi:hypothetical protein